MYSFFLNSNMFSLPFLRFAEPENESHFQSLWLKAASENGKRTAHLDSGQGFSLILKDAREKPFLSDLVFTE